MTMPKPPGPGLPLDEPSVVDRDSTSLLDSDSQARPDSLLQALEGGDLEAPSEVSIVLEDQDESDSYTIDMDLPDSISIDELADLEDAPEVDTPELDALLTAVNAEGDRL